MHTRQSLTVLGWDSGPIIGLRRRAERRVLVGCPMSTLSTTSLSDMTPQEGEALQGEDDDLRPSLSADAEVTAADDAGSKYIVAKLKELYRSHVVDAERRYHLHFNFALPTDGEIKVCVAGSARILAHAHNQQASSQHDTKRQPLSNLMILSQDSEFDANPLVLLIGQYSTGKTTFLNQ